MITNLKHQLQKVIDHLKSDFAKLQIGRANVELVETIEIESYGVVSPLKNLANISCPDPKTVKIEPWDKSILGATEKAIQEANIGINPQNMGEYILCLIPPLTEERRKQTVKLVHEESEKAKISIRNIRHDFMKKIKIQKDNGDISEDEQKRLEKQIEEVVSEQNKNVDTITKKKATDIMTN